MRCMNGYLMVHCFWFVRFAVALHTQEMKTPMADWREPMDRQVDTIVVIVLKVIGGQCEIWLYVYSGSPRETKAMWQMWEKWNHRCRLYAVPVRSQINARRIRCWPTFCSRPRRIYIHRLSVSRISSMQMRTIPTVMSGITFKFIGSRR